MKLKKILAGTLSFVIPISLFFVTYAVISLKSQNFKWLAMLIGILSGLFVIEFVKPLNGDERVWGFLKPVDKLIFAICLAMQCIVFLYPYQADMPIAALILTVVGYGLTWLIINKLGSDEMKKRLLWPKPD